MIANLVDEIREGFANLSPGKRGGLSVLPRAYPAFVYVNQEAWGVAISAPDKLSVSERFAGARLYSEPVGDGVELRLESDSVDRRNEFAVLCAQFLDPGKKGEERSRVLEDPASWWKQWRELLGNSVREKKPYSVLGELLVLERLLLTGEEPVWLGPTGSSHDIEAKSANYEVKSTISRYSSTFQAAGQFQLERASGRALFVILSRFEPTSVGESINSVVARLADCLSSTEQIEMALSRLGYERGASDRATSYKLLQSTKYLVDDNFPRITAASFVGATLPSGVVSVQYKVDLSGVEGVPFV